MWWTSSIIQWTLQAFHDSHAWLWGVITAVWLWLLLLPDWFLGLAPHWQLLIAALYILLMLYSIVHFYYDSYEGEPLLKRDLRSIVYGIFVIPVGAVAVIAGLLLCTLLLFYSAWLAFAILIFAVVIFLFIPDALIHGLVGLTG